MILLLAYGVAGLTTLLATVAREIVDRPTFGPGIAGEWAVGMGTLLFGAPAVVMMLAVIDFVLTGRRRMRRAAVVALVASLIPSALSALVIPFYPEILAIAVWLLVTGLLFGAVMRLPPARDQSNSLAALD